MKRFFYSVELIFILFCVCTFNVTHALSMLNMPKQYCSLSLY